MEQKNKSLYYLKILMYTINFLIISFLSITILITTYRIEGQYEAREFLDAITYMPREPLRMIIVVYTSFFLLLFVTEYHKKMTKNLKIRFGIYILELVLCLMIIQYLYVSYNGIILLVIADIATSIKYKQNRTIFLLVMSAVFILSDYHLISMKLDIISFQEYLSIYSANISTMMMGVRNVLVAVNIIVFGMYMLILMQNQIKENARIELLNLQLKTANEQLTNMNEQLKDYASMQEKMGETKERNRVAREIHDTLGHTMTGLSAGIDACIALIDFSVDATKEQLHVLSEISRQGIKDIRRSVNKLRPDALEQLQLEDAIEKMIKDTMTVSQVLIHFEHSEGSLKFNADEEDVIYRVVQESVTNAIRHGQAKEIWLTMEKKNKWLSIVVQDNGIGCKDIQKGFGLIHMEERIQMLQGELAYQENEVGFLVEAKVPIRWGENYD